MHLFRKFRSVIRESADFEVNLWYKSVFLLLASFALIIPPQSTSVVKNDVGTIQHFQEISAQTIALRSFSLENRYPEKTINDVFKDNILLTLNYMNGRVKNRSEIEWSDIKKPRNYNFELNPGESFAFHDQILAEFYDNVVKTTNAHFNYQDGFKSSGYLFGDGVCHLASIINWVAKTAGLFAYSPTDHSFKNINEIPEEYGVSIYYLPGGFSKSSKENLYITNNLDAPVSFIFDYDGRTLNVKITKTVTQKLTYLD